VPFSVSDVRERLAALIGTTRDDLDLLDRFDRYAEELLAPLDEVYGLDTIVEPLLEILAANHSMRDSSLHQRDRERILEPDWFQKPSTMGYVCYTDLFATNLKGLATKIPYLEGLGVTYLHLMPILKPRPGANDGGYAVADYRSLRADLGSMAELRATAEKLHDAGISLTLDLVLNHVALEHEWAEKARAGDPEYRDYFYVYDTREIPDQFETSLPEVFPDFAPGNFTWNDELDAWVWTTFNAYQWDVNWSNPKVFCEYADIIANLANHGVDCLRLDAIAFIWKRMGTSCQNEAEVHAITQALRTFSRILAPSLIFKAEAIVGPAQVGAYLGEGERAGKVSDLAYHNSLMVQIWAAIASRDASLLERSMSRFGALPTTTAWGVYLRCHDDIGWAIDDSDASSLGMSGHDHRMFLADYFTGKFPGSDAKGVDFQIDPLSGERRTSGSAASLAGIEVALATKNKSHLDTAVARYLCAYSMVFGFGGIPLLYMGDEIGMVNDNSYLKDPEKAEDNRWIHRPALAWDAATKATEKPAASAALATQVAHRIRTGIHHLINVRKTLPSLHAAVSTEVRAGRSRGVAIFDRKHPAGHLVQVYNLSDEARFVDTNELGGLYGDVHDHITGHTFNIGGGIPLAPYEVRWLTAANK
jgi:amylosucrase